MALAIDRDRPIMARFRSRLGSNESTHLFYAVDFQNRINGKSIRVRRRKHLLAVVLPPKVRRVKGVHRCEILFFLIY